MTNRLNIITILLSAICVVGGLHHWIARGKLSENHCQTLRRSGMEIHTIVVLNKSGFSQKVSFNHPAPAIDIPPTPNEFTEGLIHQVDDLCGKNKFNEALQVIMIAPQALQTDLTDTLFTHWSRVSISDASNALEQISSPALYSAALRAMTEIWKSKDPAGLTAYAYSLPVGEERNRSLSAGMTSWSLQDPASFAQWLNTISKSDELNTGIEMMLEKTDKANRSPATAMRWVELIGEPKIQLTLFNQILDEWAQTDLASAKQYVEQAGWLDDSYKQEILKSASRPGARN